MFKFFKRLVCWLLGHKDRELQPLFHIGGFTLDAELWCVRCNRVCLDEKASDMTHLFIQKRGKELENALNNGGLPFDMNLR